MEIIVKGQVMVASSTKAIQTQTVKLRGYTLLDE